MTLTAILFFIFELFQNIQIKCMLAARNAQSWNLAPIDRKMWLDGPWALYTTCILAVARFAGIAFLLYFGYRTRWFYPIILWCVSMPVSVIFVSIFQVKFNIRYLAFLGYL